MWFFNILKNISNLIQSNDIWIILFLIKEVDKKFLTHILVENFVSRVSFSLLNKVFDYGIYHLTICKLDIIENFHNSSDIKCVCLFLIITFVIVHGKECIYWSYSLHSVSLQNMTNNSKRVVCMNYRFFSWWKPNLWALTSYHE